MEAEKVLKSVSTFAPRGRMIMATPGSRSAAVCTSAGAYLATAGFRLPSMAMSTRTSWPVPRAMNPVGTPGRTGNMGNPRGRGRFRAPQRRREEATTRTNGVSLDAESEGESSAGLALWLALLEIDPAKSDVRGDATRYDARSSHRPGRNRSRLPERSEGRALIRPGMRRAATPSVAARTGPAGIEPATPGFGEAIIAVRGCT